jgi:hypothetical protein
MARAGLLTFLLIVFASALCAQAFDVSRLAIAADDTAPPRFDIKPPWGLWANRAPYPYYAGPFGIDVADDLVARDIWFDFVAESWLTGDGYRGGGAQMRARFGLFFANVSYTQLARVERNRVRESAFLMNARGHLGLTLPVPALGYLDLGVGGAGFDQSESLSRAGLSFKASASIWPIWPLGFEGWAVREQFRDGKGVNEFGARAHVQVFRHIHLTAGWRWMNVDGTSFSTHGATFGFSVQWSNLRTFFWAPFRGPAY